MVRRDRFVVASDPVFRVGPEVTIARLLVHRLYAATVRLALSPGLFLTVLALASAWVMYRWPGLIVMVGCLAGGVVMLPPQGRARLAAGARGRWRWWTRYAWRWTRVLNTTRLVIRRGSEEAWPEVRTIRSTRLLDVITLRLASGQVPGDLADAGEAFGHAVRAWRVAVTTLKPGVVSLAVWWCDTLADIITPAPLPEPDTNTTTLTVEQVEAVLAGVPVGVDEDAQTWRVPLRGGHVLVTGTTGSGKSGFLWSLIWSLAPLIRTGWVQVDVIDPKRLEGQALAPTGLAAVHVDDLVDRLVMLVGELDLRAAQWENGSRTHRPSPTSPHRVIVIDEAATLTALLPDRRQREAVDAALGALLSRGRALGFTVVLTTVDPTKEVLRWRSLLSTRVAYRSEAGHADLTLGGGAHAAGAAIELIPETTPGVAYVRADGAQDVRRVRTAHISDERITELTAWATATSPVVVNLVSEPATAAAGGA